jgi:hypothetical protein
LWLLINKNTVAHNERLFFASCFFYYRPITTHTSKPTRTTSNQPNNNKQEGTHILQHNSEQAIEWGVMVAVEQ